MVINLSITHKKHNFIEMPLCYLTCLWSAITGETCCSKAEWPCVSSTQPFNYGSKVQDRYMITIFLVTLKNVLLHGVELHWGIDRTQILELGSWREWLGDGYSAISSSTAPWVCVLPMLHCILCLCIELCYAKYQTMSYHWMCLLNFVVWIICT